MRKTLRWWLNRRGSERISLVTTEDHAMRRNETPDPQEVEQATMLDWIEACWTELATFAWQRYVAEGRGIVLLDGDWSGEVFVAYQTPQTAAKAGSSWPDDLVNVVRDYTPATDIVFLVKQRGSRGGTLLGMRTMPPQLPPAEAGQRDGSVPLVRSA